MSVFTLPVGVDDALHPSLLQGLWVDLDVETARAVLVVGTADQQIIRAGALTPVVSIYTC